MNNPPMRCIQITSYEGPRAVELVEAERPIPTETQVLIEVKACGVAFPEVLQTRGRYQIKPQLPYVPGGEVAGVIVQAPENSPWSPGDRVAAFVTINGFAEFVAAPADLVLPLPPTLSYDDGAAILLNCLTAHFALTSRGALRPGEDVLVHGAAGGVGLAAIQVARAFGAGRIIAITSTDTKAAAARAAGADESLPVEGFREAIVARGGVDIVVDPVGGDRFLDSLRCLKPHGRHLVIGFTGGEIPTVRVNRLLMNNISVVGVGWGTYALNRRAYITEQWNALLPHIASGAITPPPCTIYPLEQAAEALQSLEDRRVIGKVILRP